jgi:RNase P protein component
MHFCLIKILKNTANQMLAKHYRLTTKDVHFLLRKKKYIAGKVFHFFWFPQFHSKQFHQMSIQIPVKRDKRATHRNILKRKCMHTLRQLNFTNKKINNWYFKIFCFVPQKTVEKTKQEFEKTTEKTKLMHTFFVQDLEILSKHLRV